MAGGYQTWPLIQFSVIGEAWRLYKRHWFVWSLAMLIVMTGYGIVDRWTARDSRRRPAPRARRLPAVSDAAGACLAVPCLERRQQLLPGRNDPHGEQPASGSRPRLEDLFSVTDVWFDLILVAFLNAAATVLGFMLCAIPGFIVSGLFMLAIPLVVEGRLPATGALIQSWNALKSQWLVATLFHCVLDPLRMVRVVTLWYRHLLYRAPLLPGDLHSLPRLLLVVRPGLVEETSRAISRILIPRSGS